MRSLFFGALLALSCCQAGCDQLTPPSPKPSAKAVPAKQLESKKQVPRKADVPPAKGAGRPASTSSKLPSEFEIGRAEAQAVKTVGRVIDQSLELGPTVVVWLFDRTKSAESLVRDIAGAIMLQYGSPETKPVLAGQGSPLLTAIVAFDHEPQFVLDPPTAEMSKISTALENVAASSEVRERPLTAVKAALEKYLPLRTNERRELIFVLVTDEAAEDANLADEIIDSTRRHAIGIYCIGPPAPWGQVNPFAPDPKRAPTPPDESVPVVGPESAMSERVDIANWLPGQYGIDIVDAGFGSFVLERICRASRGDYITLRGGGSYGSRGASAFSWPNGDELRFDEAVVERYSPDYVSIADYQKLLTENKAKAALTEAAKLPKVAIEGQPASQFAKASEAQMARQLSAAQQFAAANSPRVDRLYEVLIAGEADRAKLTSRRWQAQYDLALGRVLANKVRLDGYNSMIAALKRGKTFQNPDSRQWLLESADHFETESTIQRMADKSKLYLQRVIAEHAGTPWAKIAEEELKLPLGWSWKES